MRGAVGLHVGRVEIADLFNEASPGKARQDLLEYPAPAPPVPAVIDRSGRSVGLWHILPPPTAP